MKEKLNYKKGAIIQYVLISLFTISLLLTSWGFDIAINAITTGNTEIFETGFIGIMFFMPLGVLTVLGLAIFETICLILGVPCLLLSTIALILNLHKPSLKKWKVARILNLLCLIIMIVCLYFLYANIIIAIFLLIIIVSNIYLMYFNKNIKNSISELQNQKNEISKETNK